MCLLGVKTSIKALLWVKTDITSLPSGIGYGMDMKLICIWSIFNGKPRLTGVCCKYKLL